MSQPLCYICIIGFQNKRAEWGCVANSKNSESMLRDSFAFLLPPRSSLTFCHTFFKFPIIYFGLTLLFSSSFDTEAGCG